MVKRRNKWIDIAKEIAILMVLLGHGMGNPMHLGNGILGVSEYYYLFQ